MSTEERSVNQPEEQPSLSEQRHRQRHIFLKVFLCIFRQSAGYIAEYRNTIEFRACLDCIVDYNFPLAAC